MDREKLIDKIAKLRAKGNDAGVTEEEAHAFLEAAARLMREHMITDEEVERGDIAIETIEKKGVHVSQAKMHPACATLSAIGKLTGTFIGIRLVTTREGRSKREVGGLTISGRPSDRKVADFMFDQVRNLIDGAWETERRRRLAPMLKAFKDAGVPARLSMLLKRDDVRETLASMKRGVGHKERRSFQLGMAIRLAERIEQMANREKDHANAVVVWNSQISPTDSPKTKPNLDRQALLSGYHAGDKAELGRGVDGASPTMRIAGE